MAITLSVNGQRKLRGTMVRVSYATNLRLEELKRRSGLSKGAIIGLAIEQVRKIRVRDALKENRK